MALCQVITGSGCPCQVPFGSLLAVSCSLSILILSLRDKLTIFSLMAQLQVNELRFSDTLVDNFPLLLWL